VTLFRVGVISDTHGSLPAEVASAFAGADHILHAGDVGAYSVLLDLEAIAPVTAVRGNMDGDDFGGLLVPFVNEPLGGVRFFVTHRTQDVPRTLPKGIRVVVTGHTHVASIVRRGGVTFLNPGSATRPGSGAKASVALIDVVGDAIETRVVELQ
jgi:putative phosphoesterase